MAEDLKTNFIFGGKRQIIFLIISVILFIFVPNILVILKGVNVFTFLINILSVCLGAAGTLYYTGYYHKWLRPTLVGADHFDEHNFGIEGCVKQIISLLNMAQHEVLILSGTMIRDLYELPSVVQSFERALKKGVTIKILVGKNFDTDNNQILDLFRKYSNTKSSLRIFHFPKSEDTPTPHFIVVDKSHTRIEDLHYENCSLEDISAEAISVYNYRQAIMLVEAFNRNWDSSGSPFPEFIIDNNNID
jgi:uncharacterized membrane protein YqaE (UPF0057 family)